MKVEEYAKKKGRLHPAILAFLTPYFEGFDLHRVKVRITPGNTSALGTSVWVLADRIMVQRGKFNQEFRQWVSRTDADGTIWHKSNGAVDLATVPGMVILAHECFHVQKWLTRPWWSIWAVMRSLVGKLTGRSWHSFEWERQAIDFQNSVVKDIQRREESLKVFATLR